MTNTVRCPEYIENRQVRVRRWWNMKDGKGLVSCSLIKSWLGGDLQSRDKRVSEAERV